MNSFMYQDRGAGESLLAIDRMSTQIQHKGDDIQPLDDQNDEILMSLPYKLKVELPIQKFEARIINAIDKKKQELKKTAQRAMQKVVDQDTTEESKLARKQAIVDQLNYNLNKLNSECITKMTKYVDKMFQPDQQIKTISKQRKQTDISRQKANPLTGFNQRSTSVLQPRGSLPSNILNNEDRNTLPSGNPNRKQFSLLT